MTASLDLVLDGVDGVFHLAGQPGVRASFGPDFEHYVQRNVHASGRLFEAAARRGVRVVFASSSSIYGDAESYPTAEDAVPQPDLAVRRHEALRRAPRLCARADDRARRRLRPLLHRLRAAPAPRHGVHAAPRGARARRRRSASSVTARSRGASPSSPTPSRGPIAAMERGAGGEIYNIGGGEEATMRDAIALAEADRRARAPRRAPRGRGGRREAHARRREQGGSGARLGADDVARGRSPGPVGLGRR